MIIPFEGNCLTKEFDKRLTKLFDQKKLTKTFKQKFWGKYLATVTAKTDIWINVVKIFYKRTFEVCGWLRCSSCLGVGGGGFSVLLYTRDLYTG